MAASSARCFDDDLSYTTGGRACNGPALRARVGDPAFLNHFLRVYIMLLALGDVGSVVVPSLTSNFHLGKLAATANSCSGSHGAAPQRRLGPAGSAQVGHLAGSLHGPRALLLGTHGH